MAQISDILTRARTLLQDETAPYRYADTELLEGANDALKMVRKLRPDLFFGKYKQSISDYALTDAFPIGAEYEGTVRNFVVAHAQLRNSEDAENSKAGVFLGLFEKGLIAL